MTFEEEPNATEPETPEAETETVVEEEDDFDLGGEELERGSHVSD